MADGWMQQADTPDAPRRAAGDGPRKGRWPAPALCLLAALLLAVSAAAVLRARAGSPPAFAAVGSRAPDFDLPVLGHPAQRVSLSSLRGCPVVVVFNCGCKACYDFDRRLAASARRLKRTYVVAITVNPSAYAGEKLDRFRRSSGFGWPILVDEQMMTTTRYRSSDCPRAWLIDGGGIVRYQASRPGGSPNRAVEGLTEALRAL